MGDLATAEEAFRQAHELGANPQPGLALLLLAQGKAEAAAASIRRSLEDETWDRLARSRLLPAQAEIARATGDAATARAAAEELASIADEFGTPAIRAGAEWARGHALLADGDPAGAVRCFRRASQLWREVAAPYEAARSTIALAEAHIAEGDREAASLESRTARAVFERLGAGPDARTAGELLERASRGPGDRTVRAFMFTDVVGSTTLLEAIGDRAWEDLRRWHDQALRHCFSDHGGQEVDDAGDGFFVAFPDPGSAVECAVEIQRKLADHRREHGFAPSIRIGLHATEATRSGDRYLGRGVHVAARIGALAEGGEILASRDTLADLERIAGSGSREVMLKGVAEPVVLVSIDWR
ncbi:MAG: adenylate/guanylate cyclase domain-containing protein [Actinomycetota bacterium]